MTCATRGPGPEVSILVPTTGRKSLRRAVLSALAQRQYCAAPFEVVVVDNSAEGGAAEQLTGVGDAAAPVRLVREARPGVVHARNAGAAAAAGRFVAFLDDDQEAAPGWLAALLATQHATGAQVVAGANAARLEDEGVRHADFARRFFSRRLPVSEGAHGVPCWAGGILVERASCLAVSEPFAACFNFSGGEDAYFFRSLARAGRRFAWCGTAVVYEWVPPARCTARAILKRAFAGGQGFVRQMAMAGPSGRSRCVIWMAVGLGQVLVYGALALTAGLRSERALRCVVKAASGCGKLLWFRPAEPYRPRPDAVGARAAHSLP
jgi:succinoglycan biosynthesis protein ExoM